MKSTQCLTSILGFEDSSFSLYLGNWVLGFCLFDILSLLASEIQV